MTGEKPHNIREENQSMRYSFISRAALAFFTVLPFVPAAAAAKVLRVAPPAAIVDYDPHGPNANVRDTLMVDRQIYDPLVEFKGEAPVPRLATAWEQIDPTTWRFTLRPQVRFQDGTPFTSADVVASVERMARQKGGLGPLWTAFEKVEAPDPMTVVIKLKEPVGPFLRNVSLLQIAPAKAIAEIGEKYGAAVRMPGTGPFKLKAFRPAQFLELDANPDYWDKPPTLTGIRFQSIPEIAGRITALVNNEIDLTWLVPDDQVDGLKATPSVKVESVPSAIYYYNWFNPQRKPFNDVRVRQALWHAVDVKKIIADLLPNTGLLARAPIPETVFGFKAEEPYAYDPEKARKLLAEAGYANGFSAEVKYSDVQGPELEQIGLSFISYWSKVGVKVTPTRMENSVWLKDLRELNWDMVLSTNPSYTEDADYTIGRLYTTKRSGYENPEATKLLVAAQRENDQAKRKELYGQAIDILWKDALGIFPADIKAVYAYRDGVSGVEMSPTLTPRLRGVSLK